MATDGTQFLIELNAKFTGGDAAVSTLADLGDRMLAAGAKVADFEAASKAAATAMEAAAESAQAANAAVAEQATKYEQAQRAADRAAKSVEYLGDKAQAQTQKLQNALDAGDARAVTRAENRIWSLVTAQQEAINAANKAKAALEAEGAALDKLKSKAEAANAKQTDLTKGTANLKSAGEKAAKVAKEAGGSGKVNEMAEALGKLGGPAGKAGQEIFGLASGFSKLKGAMGAGGPYVAIAVAIVAIATAAIAAAIAITQWGVAMADAGRTQSLMAAGIARSVEGGKALETSIDKLSRTVPLTSDELTSMAKGLADSGLRGKELTDTLERNAVAAAQLKFGPEFGKQMLSLDQQSKRFSANLADTFGGLEIEGLLSGIQTLVALFDSTTASGKAMKFLFEALFQPLVDAAVAAIPKVERFFLYLEILALKAYIALKPYGFIFEFIGKALLVVAAIIGGALAIAVGGIIVTFGIMLASFTATALAIYGLYEAIVALVTDPMAALEGFVAFMGELGTDLINGLVYGITEGAAAVYNAMASVVTGAIDGAKKLLGIASPSAVFADIGGNTAAGFAQGVEGGADDAAGALEAMVAPPDATAKAPAGAGGGVTVNIAAINVNGQNAKEQALDFVDQLTQALEALNITVGGGGAPAHA